MQGKKPIVLAITAASGIIYGMRTLDFLLKNKNNVDLVISQNAYYIAKQEINLELSHDSEIIKQNVLNYLDLPDREKFLKVWLNDELWADIASGSHQTSGMIIAPASMAAVSAIASGYADNLITRAADVTIKENRNLVIMPRETPLSSIHLENMLKLSKLGVKIVPPIIGFYSNIQSVDDYINFAAGKLLDAFNISNELYRRWQI